MEKYNIPEFNEKTIAANDKAEKIVASVNSNEEVNEKLDEILKLMKEKGV